MRRARPTSVAVVSWILIVLGGISLVTSLFTMGNPVALDLMKQSPIPVPLQLVFSFVGLTIMLLCGVMMLKGQNWARLLYVGWSIVGILIGLATSPMKLALLPGVVVFLVVAFILFRPNANVFFTAGEGPSDEQGD